MQDTCRIGVYSASPDAYNNPEAVYDYSGAAVACGLEHLNPNELQGTGEVPVIEARLRLPLTTSVKETDRIRVTHRYGGDVAGEDYEIVGPARRGPSGLVLDLRRVTDD
jgi:hypothetical protein